MFDVIAAFLVGAVAGGITVFFVLRNNKKGAIKALDMDFKAELDRLVEKVEGEAKAEVEKLRGKIKDKLK